MAVTPVAGFWWQTRRCRLSPAGAHVLPGSSSGQSCSCLCLAGTVAWPDVGRFVTPSTDPKHGIIKEKRDARGGAARGDKDVSAAVPH